MYGHIHTYMYTNTYVHQHTHTYGHTHTCTHMSEHTGACTHTRALAHSCMHSPTHTWALACTCAHACIHTRAHTCAHVQKLFAPWVCWRARGRSPLAAALLPPEIPAGLAHAHVRPVRARVYGRACACTCAPITRVRACERAHHGTPALPPGRQRVPRVAHGLRRLGPLPERAARGPGAPAATPSPGRTSPLRGASLYGRRERRGRAKTGNSREEAEERRAGGFGQLGEGGAAKAKGSVFATIAPRGCFFLFSQLCIRC